MKRNDTLWKGILENTFSDFLRFFFKDADALFDLDKGFEFLDKELEQLFPTEQIKAPKFVDKLVKVYSRDGDEKWILVHIEVQGYEDKQFGERMFTYFYRILDRYERKITSIALFTDGDKNFNPYIYEYNYLGTKLTFQFNTYKIMDQDETLLLQNDNPFSIVILTVLLALKSKKVSNDDLYSLKYSLAKTLVSKRIEKKKINDLLIFLQRYVTFADSGYNVKFDKEIDGLIENKTAMGIRELVLDQAKNEGIDMAKEEVVRNLLLANRFTVEEISNFAGVTEIFVIEIQESLK
ncbi:hypothetical protein [Dyadobacter sp. CY356]|uniref:hypothetical protein n=1 Tax=Dyadobacter sp. CY356 TaxID=2906442 RepID=UPI001F2192BA|nr:hypothetical protein [Dyadobacter sp. CY356]MCF0057602.1 hypothetical protein [Dyadobacter sp. CY356]